MNHLRCAEMRRRSFALGCPPQAHGTPAPRTFISRRLDPAVTATRQRFKRYLSKTRDVHVLLTVEPAEAKNKNVSCVRSRAILAVDGVGLAAGAAVLRQRADRLAGHLVILPRPFARLVIAPGGG